MGAEQGCGVSPSDGGMLVGGRRIGVCRGKGKKRVRVSIWCVSSERIEVRSKLGE